jgi:hypothetical protein
MRESHMHKARLVIAKLDRLSRNLAFIATLMDRKVDFVCCDNPTATKFTIHILAAVAEHERYAISARTKDARLRRGARARSSVAAATSMTAMLRVRSSRTPKEGRFTAARWPRVRQRLAPLAPGRYKRAAQRAADIAPTIEALQEAGATSLRAIADGLNAQGIPTARGSGEWLPTQVARVLERP